MGPRVAAACIITNSSKFAAPDFLRCAGAVSVPDLILHHARSSVATAGPDDQWLSNISRPNAVERRPRKAEVSDYDFRTTVPDFAVDSLAFRRDQTRPQLSQR
jgi:hypothetical protein